MNCGILVFTLCLSILHVVRGLPSDLAERKGRIDVGMCGRTPKPQESTYLQLVGFILYCTFKQMGYLDEHGLPKILSFIKLPFLLLKATAKCSIFGGLLRFVDCIINHLLRL
ncbi:hypothetical protein WA026_023474 [Henosepilachna vigintioctopunctata]|uniref:Uncharacterized protein n=1 Tax=Henosepilachna vigintioctopunctata TaxID=420089 RepID=A0AAW1UYS5_9CUCU